jgi:hypothetical protein
VEDESNELVTEDEAADDVKGAEVGNADEESTAADEEDDVAAEKTSRTRRHSRAERWRTEDWKSRKMRRRRTGLRTTERWTWQTTRGKR